MNRRTASGLLPHLPQRAMALYALPSAPLHQLCRTPLISPVLWSWSTTASRGALKLTGSQQSRQRPPCLSSNSLRIRGSWPRVTLVSSVIVLLHAVRVDCHGHLPGNRHADSLEVVDDQVRLPPAPEHLSIVNHYDVHLSVVDIRLEV